MMNVSRAKHSIIISFLIMLLFLQFQNCSNGNVVRFFTQPKSLSLSIGGGSGYDGKPDKGYYCRVNDSIQAQIKNIQSLVKIDDSGIHLISDNGKPTALNYQVGDASVTYTSIVRDYIGVSRGIFKKCEVDGNQQPEPPVGITDAYCTSNNGNVAVVVNKNIQNKELDFKLVIKEGAAVKSTAGISILKRANSNNSSYTSISEAFKLTIDQGTSQTTKGYLEAIIDEKSSNFNLDCRQASSEPTVIFDKDMELSSTWIDTSELVGYWKLNEANASEGTVIKDYSKYSSNGVLQTGSDGIVKSDSSVLGGALFLDGTDDRVEIPYPTDRHLEFGRRSFSYMVWIKKVGNAGSFDMPIYNGGASAFTEGFDIECGSSLAFGCYAQISDGLNQPNSVGYARFIDDARKLLGHWVLLSVVVDRNLNQLNVYLDESLMAATDITGLGDVSNSVSSLFIGAMGRHNFFGSVDDFAIWNRNLSEDEIKEIFQRLRPKFY